MADETEPIEEIAFLARSEARVRLLELLLERRVATRHECREHLDASRSTVSRTLDALDDRGWVEPAGRSYELTTAGAVVAESFLDLVDSVEATTVLAPFLRWFPLSEFDLDVAALRDAELTVATDGDPYAPAERQTELVRTVAELRCFLPSTELEGCRLVHERCLSGELTMESVVSPCVAETISGGEYVELFHEMTSAGAHEVFRAPEPLPFYLGLADDGLVHVGVEDDEGFPRALLVTEDPSVCEWGESVYEAYRARARELSAADFE